VFLVLPTSADVVQRTEPRRARAAEGNHPHKEGVHSRRRFLEFLGISEFSVGMFERKQADRGAFLRSIVQHLFNFAVAK